jgi:hypothetical protein
MCSKIIAPRLFVIFTYPFAHFTQRNAAKHIMARPRLPKPAKKQSLKARHGAVKKTLSHDRRVGFTMRTRPKNAANVEQTTPSARVAKAVASKKQNVVTTTSKKQTIATTTPKKPISRYQNGLLNLTRTRKYLLDKYEGFSLCFHETDKVLGLDAMPLYRRSCVCLRKSAHEFGRWLRSSTMF